VNKTVVTIFQFRFVYAFRAYTITFALILMSVVLSCSMLLSSCIIIPWNHLFLCSWTFGSSSKGQFLFLKLKLYIVDISIIGSVDPTKSTKNSATQTMMIP